MPLSEHEQRQLEQIEQALYADHPRLAKVMRAKDPRVHYRRRVMQASIGFLIGVGLLAAGLTLTHKSWLSIIGFVIMLVSSMWAIASYRRMSGILVERGRGRDRRPPKPATSAGMMDRFEERWRRRQERDR